MILRNFEIESTNEMRRKAPFHYQAKAENSAFTARLLNGLTVDQLDEFKAKHDYGRSAGYAVLEAFRREAAFALESMIKANIALIIQYGESLPNVKTVRFTHDIFSLWYEARLPKIDKGLQKQLVFGREVLEWSGRYAAPANDKTDTIIKNKLDEIDPPDEGIHFKVPEYFDADGFEQLYELSKNSFFERVDRLIP